MADKTDAAPEPREEPPRRLDRPGNVRKIVWALGILSAVLFVVDPLVAKHGPFEIEYFTGFYGLFGFIGCVFLVLAAKELRTLIKRPEDYYDR